MKNWRKRFRSAWDARFRQRVTGLGVAYASAVALVGIAAFVSANNLLFLIFAAMVATLMISGFTGRLSLAGLELDLLLPTHASARRSVRAAVRLRNLKRWMPSFSVHLTLTSRPGEPPQPSLYFPLVTGGASIEEPVELYFPNRGAHTERAFEFSTRFPFGFVERRENVTIRHEVIVYPCLEPRPGFESLLASITDGLAALERGQGTDLYRIRPYELSESARHVDWKATAHTGALQVREFSREREATVLIYLDLDIPNGTEGWFESAVECAAFLAFELAERNVRVRFVSQTRDVTVPDDGDIYTILKYLAVATPAVGGPQNRPEQHDFHIVFSQNPQRFRELGWGDPQASFAWLVGPELV